jgi:hypothetical protein
MCLSSPASADRRNGLETSGWQRRMTRQWVSLPLSSEVLFPSLFVVNILATLTVRILTVVQSAVVVKFSLLLLLFFQSVIFIPSFVAIINLTHPFLT